jgi:transposase
MPKYDIGFKIETVMFYKENGLTSTLNRYNISNTALRKWCRDYESGSFMRKQNASYTIEEKLEIINYYRSNDVLATEEKYNISPSVFYKWERILIEEGIDALGVERRGRGRKPSKVKNVDEDEDLLKEVQRLRLENAYLKKLKALAQEKQK